MILLVLLTLYLGSAKGQDQQQITLSLPHDPTPNIIEPVSTNQPFYQYGFSPQPVTLSYPLPTLLPYKPTPAITEKQSFNQPQPTVGINHQNQPFNQPQPTVATNHQNQPFNGKPAIGYQPQVISTNIPLQARYRVEDHGLITSGAHAYPVQHSVEIHHVDYEPYEDVFIPRHLEPVPRNRNLPPITRPIHPQFNRPLVPQQPLNPYPIPNENHQRLIRPQAQFIPFIPINENQNVIAANTIRSQQPFKLFTPSNLSPNINDQKPRTRVHILPKKNQNPNQREYSPPQQFQQTTPPNLPHNFKAVPIFLNQYQTQTQNPTQIKLPPAVNTIPVLPKPLPSPFAKNIPVSPRPLPIPISSKPAEAVKIENKPVKVESSEEREEKRPEQEEEEEESDEDEESDEEEDYEDSEEDSSERDYRPRYSHNYHEDNEFDRRRYRPTFDAAKYIFNEESEEDDERESEEDRNSSEERHSNSKNERYKQKEVEPPKRKEGPYREKAKEPAPRRPEKGNRPHQKRVAKEESEESSVEETRRMPHARRFIKRPANYRR